MKKVWRYDTFYKSLVFVEVEDKTPIGVWLPPLYGEGYYIYLETIKEAKMTLQEDIQGEIQALKDKLEELLSTEK